MVSQTTKIDSSPSSAPANGLLRADDKLESPLPTQRFYCPGCREYHETESLLEAVRREGEKIRLEKGTVTHDKDEDSRS